MSIPETQLERWANKGATQGSVDTYASIRAALESHAWPDGMEYEVYLQGSYANDTNTRGNSDVDVICEMTSSVYSNRTEAENRALGIGVGRHTLQQFRAALDRALSTYYGAGSVSFDGNKSIAVAAANGRLKSDVVPCLQYTEYNGNHVTRQGIKFYGRHNGVEYINYPKLHIERGQNKNSRQRTNGWYKPAIRMFKNARVTARELGYLGVDVPSHFVESLIFNVPDSAFGGSYQDTFSTAVNYLNNVLILNSGATLEFQHGAWILLGTHTLQMRVEAARALVAAYIRLWNEWYD